MFEPTATPADCASAAVNHVIVESDSAELAALTILTTLAKNHILSFGLADRGETEELFLTAMYQIAGVIRQQYT